MAGLAGCAMRRRFSFTRPSVPHVVVVAGRQIVTRERLELLSLFSSASIDHNLPLEDSIHAVLSQRAVSDHPLGIWEVDVGTRQTIT